MKPFMHLIAAAAVTAAFSTSVIAQPAASAEAPDVLVKRISAEVIDSVKNDKAIQSGDRSKIMGLVNTKILPANTSSIHALKYCFILPLRTSLFKQSHQWLNIGLMGTYFREIDTRSFKQVF